MKRTPHMAQLKVPVDNDEKLTFPEPKSSIRILFRQSDISFRATSTLPVSTIPFSARQSPDYRVALHRIGSSRLEVSDWFG